MENTASSIDITNDLSILHHGYELLTAEIGKVIVGQQDVIRQVMTCLLAGGHCLLLGVPGLAKTLLVSTLSHVLNLGFNRIQFTPDLMPSDIIGTEILDEGTGKRELRFTHGPVFTNLLLADEINRTPPKTQAAMLEAMQERAVTANGRRYDLPAPFFVLATQNPIEQEGTYPLPEAQLDRFMFLVRMEYPTREQEIQILSMTTGNTQATPEHVLDAEAILYLQQVIRAIPASDHVIAFCADLARATRPGNPDAPEYIRKNLAYGAGPRAGQYLLLAAKATAALEGRLNVSCEDVMANAHAVLRHRIACNFHAAGENLTTDDIITMLLKERTA